MLSARASPHLNNEYWERKAAQESAAERYAHYTAVPLLSVPPRVVGGHAPPRARYFVTGFRAYVTAAELFFGR